MEKEDMKGKISLLVNIAVYVDHCVGFLSSEFLFGARQTQETICAYNIMHLDWRPPYGYLTQLPTVHT